MNKKIITAYALTMIFSANVSTSNCQTSIVFDFRFAIDKFHLKFLYILEKSQSSAQYTILLVS